MKLFLFLLIFPIVTFAQTSRYSTLDARRCQNLTHDEESESASWSCNGVAGYKLILAAGDLRETLTVVTPNRREHELNLWHLHSGFSGVGQTAEWRMQGARPKALIVRYNVSEDPDDSTKLTSFLMVAKVSATGACVVGEVRPSANQNVAARRMADRAANMPCVNAD